MTLNTQDREIKLHDNQHLGQEIDLHGAQYPGQGNQTTWRAKTQHKGIKLHGAQHPALTFGGGGCDSAD